MLPIHQHYNARHWLCWQQKKTGILSALLKQHWQPECPSTTGCCTCPRHQAKQGLFCFSATSAELGWHPSLSTFAVLPRCAFHNPPPHLPTQNHQPKSNRIPYFSSYGCFQLASTLVCTPHTNHTNANAVCQWYV